MGIYNPQAGSAVIKNYTLYKIYTFVTMEDVKAHTYIQVYTMCSGAHILKCSVPICCLL